MAVAQLVKRNGHRVAFHLTPELLQVRLYKGNRHTFWAMTKNILGTLRGRFWMAPMVMLLPVLVFWTPILCAIVGVREARPGLLSLGIVTYGLQYATIWAGRRLLRFRPLKALLFPLVAIPVICCMARALFLYIHQAPCSGADALFACGENGFIRSQQAASWTIAEYDNKII